MSTRITELTLLDLPVKVLAEICVSTLFPSARIRASQQENPYTHSDLCLLGSQTTSYPRHRHRVESAADERMGELPRPALTCASFIDLRTTGQVLSFDRLSAICQSYAGI